MDAGVDFLIAWLILNLATFYMDYVEGVDGNLTELRATARNLIAERDIVARPNYSQQNNERQGHVSYKLLQISPDVSWVEVWVEVYCTGERRYRPEDRIRRAIRSRICMGKVERMIIA